jgi:hypothetical protein
VGGCNALQESGMRQNLCGFCFLNIRQYKFKYKGLSPEKITEFNFLKPPQNNNEPLLVYRLIVVIKKCEIAFCLKKLWNETIFLGKLRFLKNLSFQHSECYSSLISVHAYTYLLSLTN